MPMTRAGIALTQWNDHQLLQRAQFPLAGQPDRGDDERHLVDDESHLRRDGEELDVERRVKAHRRAQVNGGPGSPPMCGGLARQELHRTFGREASDRLTSGAEGVPGRGSVATIDDDLYTWRPRNVGRVSSQAGRNDDGERGLPLIEEPASFRQRRGAVADF
jgi:hypothetical protein